MSSAKGELSLFDERFAALRNAHYHMSRQAWFEGLNRMISFLIILSGTAFAWKVSQQVFWIDYVLAMLTTSFGAIQLVLDLGGQARIHDYLKKKYFDIASEIVQLESPNLADRARLSSKLLALSADEPPTYLALDAMAYNQIVNSQYGESGSIHRIDLSRWQLFTRHILRHSSVDFAKLKRRSVT